MHKKSMILKSNQIIIDTFMREYTESFKLEKKLATLYSPFHYKHYFSTNHFYSFEKVITH